MNKFRFLPLCVVLFDAHAIDHGNARLNFGLSCNSRLCGFFRVSEYQIEEMVSVCVWDRQGKKYKSQCRRRSLSTNSLGRFEFAECGCCSTGQERKNPKFCSYQQPVCSGDPSCPGRLNLAKSRICYNNGKKEVSTCVDPFRQTGRRGSFACGECEPLVSPSSLSSVFPTLYPTSVPSENPSSVLSSNPTPSPTISPIKAASLGPTRAASEKPTPLLSSTTPTVLTSDDPSPVISSLSPSIKVTESPTIGGSVPSESPTHKRSVRPSNAPTFTLPGIPSENPTAETSSKPSIFSTLTQPTILWLEDVAEDGLPANLYPLAAFQGDCDSDGDCLGNLTCFQRVRTESVPGCGGLGTPATDYCHTRPDGFLVNIGNDGTPVSNFPLPECAGDCDFDSECEGDLVCFYRLRSEPVPGCFGDGRRGSDYCIKLENTLTSGMDGNLPMGSCLGHCNNDTDCEGSLKCFQRTGTEKVPGCHGQGDLSTNYCSADAVTYAPGEATVYENGLLLSTGLTSRIIATRNKKVVYDTGERSNATFHTVPDGGAVFEDKDTGGWIYVSNSESHDDGGVGAIRFDSSGRVVGYQRVLNGTHRNCGGGKTFFNTWLTCEEYDDGHVWEADPWGKSGGRKTIVGELVGEGMNYESAAYDNRNPQSPKFYFTVDETMGPLIQFSPDRQAVEDALATGDYSQLLHSNATGTASVSYFEISILNADGSGTFQWVPELWKGRESAAMHHKMGEGIDIRDGILYYTTKKDHFLFIINLSDGTFQRSSTTSGAFDSQPDQIASLLNQADGSVSIEDNPVLYFCEDGGDNCGVHGRDAQGRFLTILQDAGAMFSGETSGLAWSPDGMFMYVAFQRPGHIFEIRRVDGKPFQGQRLDIKYHQDDSSSNEHPFSRDLKTHHHQSCHVPRRVGNDLRTCQHAQQ